MEDTPYESENLLQAPILWTAPVSVVAHPRGGWAARLVPPARAMLADPSGLEVQLADGTRAALPHGRGPRTGHAYLPLNLPDALLAVGSARPLGVPAPVLALGGVLLAAHVTLLPKMGKVLETGGGKRFELGEEAVSLTAAEVYVPLVAGMRE